MNPIKSLMGFFIALALTIPAAPSRAAGEPEWVSIPIQNGPTFYIRKTALDKLKKSDRGMEALHPQPKDPAQHNAYLEKTVQGTYRINYKRQIYKTEPSAWASASGTAQTAAAAKTGEAPLGSGAPGVENDGLPEIIAKSQNLSKIQQVEAVKNLRALKTSNPPLYETLIAMSPEDRGAFFSLPGPLEEKIKKASDSSLIKKVVDQSAALGHAGHKAPEVADVVSKVTMGDDGKPNFNNVLVDLTKRIEAKDPGQLADIAKRFDEYTLETKNHGGYIDDAVRKQDKLLQRMKELTKGWIAKEKPGRVAALYYVMGHEGVLKLQEPVRLRQGLLVGLDDCMTFYTKHAGKGKEHCPERADRNPVGPFTGSSGQQSGPSANNAVNQWWDAFYEDAAVAAENLVTKHDLLKKIIDGLPPEGEGKGDGKGQAPEKNKLLEELEKLGVKEFGWRDLYDQGGIVEWIPTPGKKDKNGDQAGRYISMKIFTKMVNNRPVDEIGIFDISDPKEHPNAHPSSWKISGRRFALNGRDTSFTLVKGGAKYNLKYTSDGRVMLGNHKAKKDEEFAINTGKDDLLKMRHEQAEAAPEMTVGGRNYRVLGQGGGRGSLLLYETLPNGDLKLGYKSAVAKPKFAVEVNEMIDGMPTPLPTPQPIGQIGPNKADFWYMGYNDDTDRYAPKKCDGAELPCEYPKADKPSTPAPAPTPGPTQPAGNKPGGGETGGGTASGASSAELSACNLPPERILSNDTVTPKYERSWKYSVHTAITGNSGATNLTYLCIFGNRALGFNGVIVKDGIKEDGGNLIIETVVPENFIPPSQLNDNGVVEFKGKPEFVNGQSRTELVDGAIIVIPIKGLAEGIDAIVKKTKKHPNSVQLASMEMKTDLGRPDLKKVGPVAKVYVKNVPEVPIAIHSAIARFGAGSHIFKDPKYSSEINKYVAEMGVQANNAKPSDEDPHVNIHFFPYTNSELETREKKFITVMSATWIDSKKDSNPWALFYCPNPKILNLRFSNAVKIEECNAPAAAR